MVRQFTGKCTEKNPAPSGNRIQDFCIGTHHLAMKTEYATTWQACCLGSGTAFFLNGMIMGGDVDVLGSIPNCCRIFFLLFPL